MLVGHCQFHASIFIIRGKRILLRFWELGAEKK